MNKLFFIYFLLLTSIFAKDCSPYFNPQKFYESPDFLKELLHKTFKEEIFIERNFKNEQIIENEILKKDSFIKSKDFIYPIKSGFWKYKKTKGKIDEVNISKVEIYRYSPLDIANTINDDFENFWNDYIEDAYEMQLTPEQTLFRYNNTYFSMSVFIYGVIGDSTPLNGTVVNFWLKDYTKQVNIYIRCMKEKNDS